MPPIFQDPIYETRECVIKKIKRYNEVQLSWDFGFLINYLPSKNVIVVTNTGRLKDSFIQYNQELWPSIK